MTPFLTELHTTLRALWRSPGFLASAVICLALGLGANIAVMSAVDRLLLRPLPYPDAQRLIQVQPRDPRTGVVEGPMTMADFLDIRSQCHSLEVLEACTDRNRTLEGLDEPLRIDVGMVTANYFRTLGVRPQLGRAVFTAEEENAPHATVTLLRHDFWKERLGGDPQVIGRALILDGRPLVVVGVLSPELRPLGRLQHAQVFTPEAISFAGRSNRGMGTFEVMGRMRPGVSLSQTMAEVHTVALRIGAAVGNPQFDAAAVSVLEEVTRPLRTPILLLQAAVGLVLLIACFNVVSLQLVRNTSRLRELAIRRALGASPWQLWRLFLAESLLLGIMGALAGLGLSFAFQKALVLLAASLNVPLELGLYPALAGAGLLAGFLTGLVLALMSGMMAQRIQLNDVLREGTKGTFSKGQRWTLKGLVIAELALSVALLLGSGLLVRSMLNLNHTDPGFQTANRLMVRVPLPPQKYPDEAATDHFLKRLDPALRAIPGVQAVGVNDTLPLEYAVNGAFLGDSPENGKSQYCRIHSVTPGYFETMGIPLMGRVFSPDERKVCVINRLLADRLWKGENAVGKNLYFGQNTVPWVVTGVAGNTVEQDLREHLFAQIYTSAHTEGLFEGAIVVLKVQGDPGRYSRIVKKTLRELDPSLAIPDPKAYRDVFRESYGVVEVFSLVLLGFGGMALFLAAVGLYGVISQITQQRRREIGVRMALGARPLQVAGDVLREALFLAGCGLLLGSLAGWGLSRGLSGQLYGVSSPGAALYVAVLGVLALITFVASLIPALRAAFTSPSVALRSE